MSSGQPAHGQGGPRTGGSERRASLLRLRSGEVRTADLPNLLSADLRQALAGHRAVIQLDGPLTANRRAALEAAGVWLGDYLPDHAFLADLSELKPGVLPALGFVKWVGRYRPDWRIDAQIGRRTPVTAERRELAARGRLAVSVYLFEGELPELTASRIEGIDGAQVLLIHWIGQQPVLNVILPANGLGPLAQLAGVQFVEEYPELVYRNSSDRWIVQSDVPDFTPLYEHGLCGQGQVLGHLDGKLAVDHCSFYDSNPIGPAHRKILAYNATLGYDLHGTHTAGTAVGDGGAWTDTRGVAYLARLVHNSIPSLSESQMFDRLDLHRGQGATVHTNSWGNDSSTAYDGLCRAIDNFCWLYDDQLVCFAVSNLGTLRNPENAKNVLAVGASQDAPNQGRHCFGGAGPTADGRRKPEIYAPGCGTNSSTGSGGCGTVALTGTSMACPAIAGTALLVRQYFTDGYYPTGTPLAVRAFNPTGALVKAALLNCAVDMTGIAGYPSDLEGWGRVLADDVLYFPGDRRRLVVYECHNNGTGSLSTGQTGTYVVGVDGSNEQLRVTLVWHDAPGAVNASDPVVNNLDLVVTSPSGRTYLGNVFAGGESISGGSPDPRNNVEQVHVSRPELGSWTIAVSAAAVNVGRQGYGLVVSGEVADLSCPSISSPPTSQGVEQGGVARFSVEAGGGGPQIYQWRKGGLPLRDGGNIRGAAAAALTIDPVQLADAGQYDVLVANACGEVISDPATLTVWPVGDVNCDGIVSFADIDPFVAAMRGQEPYYQQQPDCNWHNADCNRDGQIDWRDINPFVTLLLDR